MRPQSHVVRVRLAVLILLALLGTLLACGPVWSPDGKRLLFPTAIEPTRMGIGLYDRDTDQVTSLFEGKEREHLFPAWTPDGTHAVILCRGPQPALVVQPVPTGAVRRIPITLPDDDVVPTALPVVHGRHLFVGGKGMQRIDLATGAIDASVTAEGRDSFAVVAAGTGLGYAKAPSVGPGEYADWEVGTLDPETLERRPLVRRDETSPWDVMPVPAFTTDGARIALPARARDGKQAAILVFAKGALETTLPIDGDAQLGNVVWTADGATLCASLSRPDPDEPTVSVFVLETTVSGSVARETRILRVRPANADDPTALLCPCALSPDGRFVALSTALLETLAPAEHGLILIDRKDKNRTVRRVPFPAPKHPTLRLCGSDALHAFATSLAEHYQADIANPPTQATGGGASAGFAAVLNGTADLATAARTPDAQELVTAQARGTTLVEHRVARDVLAVCVHPDNPLTEVTLAQIGAAFGTNATRTWSAFGVVLPGGADDMHAFRVKVGSSSHELLRIVIPTLGRLGAHATMVEDLRDAIGLVANDRRAIACIPVAFVDERVKVLRVASKPDTPAVAPDAADYPLARHLSLWTRGEPTPAIAKFLQWLRSDEAQRLTKEAGFLPLR